MKNKSLRLAFLALVALSLAACQPAEVPTEPSLENAWIRALPPGMKMTAGFGTLSNGTADMIEIASFSSPQFRGVSLHLTEVVDGVSSMHEVESMSLGAGESLEMAPGGYHLMLMGPRGGMAVGQMIELDVSAADGRVFRFQVPMEKR